MSISGNMWRWVANSATLQQLDPIYVDFPVPEEALSALAVGQAVSNRFLLRFIITTNEGLLDLSGHGAGFAFDIEDSHHRFYGDGCVTVTGPSMTIKPVIGPAGKYTVDLADRFGGRAHRLERLHLHLEAERRVHARGRDVASAGLRREVGRHRAPDPQLGTDAFAKPTANVGLVVGSAAACSRWESSLPSSLFLTGQKEAEELTHRLLRPLRSRVMSRTRRVGSTTAAARRCGYRLSGRSLGASGTRSRRVTSASAQACSSGVQAPGRSGRTRGPRSRSGSCRGRCPC